MGMKSGKQIVYTPYTYTHRYKRSLETSTLYLSNFALRLRSLSPKSGPSPISTSITPRINQNQTLMRYTCASSTNENERNANIQMLLCVMHYADGTRSVQPSPTDDLSLAIHFAKQRLSEKRGRKANIRTHGTVEDSKSGQTLWDSRNLNS